MLITLLLLLANKVINLQLLHARYAQMVQPILMVLHLQLVLIVQQKVIVIIKMLMVPILMVLQLFHQKIVQLVIIVQQRLILSQMLNHALTDKESQLQEQQ